MIKFCRVCNSNTSFDMSKVFWYCSLCGVQYNDAAISNEIKELNAATNEGDNEEYIELVIEKNTPAIYGDRIVESIGLETLGGVFTALLQTGTLTPALFRQTLSTAEDYQKGVTIRLYRGNNGIAQANYFIGEINISGIPPLPRGSSKINVELFTRNKDLVLKVGGYKNLNVSNIAFPEKDGQSAKVDNFEKNYKNTTRAGISEFKRIKCDVCGRMSRIQYIEDRQLDHSCQFCSVPFDRKKESNEQLDQGSELDLAIEELNNLVGLASVKLEISSLADFILIQSKRRQQGKKIPDLSTHLIFSGNPGTGKTTVARLVGRILKALGVCRTDTVIETDRSGMVGGYVGQTALKTKDIIQSALGGVLFIDEAYALSPKGEYSNDFGHEAIDCLLKEMEDHRDDLVVIAAGYPDEMSRFLNSNPGLQSRFTRTIVFEDYSAEEMVQIFTDLCTQNEYRLDPDVGVFVRNYFDEITLNKERSFANGRTVRNLFETTLRYQSKRVRNQLRVDPDISLDLFIRADLEQAITK